VRRYQWSGLLETDQKTAGVDSNKPGLKKNPDGSVTIWFSPKAPAGQLGSDDARKSLERVAPLVRPPGALV
jgi:uncharacterized protein DUF1214